MIGNRDELHARPAEPLGRWADPEHLIAGRDSLAGGTWLGVSEQGRLAVVTNLHGFGAPHPDRASRGDLLKDYLSGQGSFADLDAADYAAFNPFNLVTVSGDEAIVHSNRPARTRRVLNPGIHGLSNGPVAQPWPKSPYLNAALAQWIADDSGDPMLLLDPLFDQNSHAPDDSAAAYTLSKSEPEHSPVFIRNPTYGTRCSTVVAIDHDGNGTIIERRFAPSGTVTGDTHLAFSWR